MDGWIGVDEFKIETCWNCNYSIATGAPDRCNKVSSRITYGVIILNDLLCNFLTCYCLKCHYSQWRIKQRLRHNNGDSVKFQTLNVSTFFKSVRL